ncbi:hypothetical protein IX51_03170 [uncultured archaeon]|nr:hypothetical protein IX51_03170 [uncultured archaeon]HKJ97259.1 hypothetical protein [Thermoplasmataceae archaeon]
MTEDFETLKVIRDKEKSADEEVEEFLQSQKKKYEDARTRGTSQVERKREELENQYNRKMEELKRELETKRLEIIEEGEAKATTIRLSISDKDIEKIVLDALNQYLED